MMGGSGMMDFMVKSYRNNMGLLKNGKKSLKKIYEENNYFYVRKKVAEKTKEFDPEKKADFPNQISRKTKKSPHEAGFFIHYHFQPLWANLLVHLLKLKLDPLRQWQFSGIVDGVCLTPHVCFPCI